MPWNHTFGGNDNFNLVLRTGGTIHIDAGKPRPARSRRRSRTCGGAADGVFQLPRAFDLLLAALESDDDLRATLLLRPDRLLCRRGAAADSLGPLEELSINRGRALPLLSAWGATETSPLATVGHFQMERSGMVGLPMPGSELKLVPSGDKMEVRVRGPKVTPGYYKAPELTAKAFDAEGFFRSATPSPLPIRLAPNWVCSSTAASPRTSSSFRNLGQCRHAAGRGNRGIGAARAGHRRHRP